MANSVVRLPVGYFPDPEKGRPLFNAKIYVGVIDLDPRIVANQKTVTGRQESGAEITLAQPVRTSSGGVPIDDSGNVVTLLVDGSYSLAVDDSGDDQKYFFANVLDGEPVVLTVLGVYTDITFNTVADAIAGTLPDSTTLSQTVGQTARTLGYTSANDGGGAEYVVVAAGTGTDDGGSYHDMDNGLQLELIHTSDIDVKIFGALGNDLTDDTVAFQNCHDFLKSEGGGVVHIPEGSFRVQGVIFESGVSWIGTGTDSTFIKIIPGVISTTGIFISTSTAPDDITGIRFEDFTLIGDGTSSNFIPNGDATVPGIDFSPNTVADKELNQIYFSRLWVRFCTVGINLIRSVRFLPITGCRFWNNDVGLFVGAEHPVLSDSEFRYNTVGLDGIIQDMKFMAVIFSFNQTGSTAQISRSSFLGCAFWRSRIVGITGLLEHNTFNGCLFSGADTFWTTLVGGTNESTCIGISSRGTVINGSLFFGGNGKAAIEYLSNNPQHSFDLSNNTFVLSDGHAIEKAGSGTISGLNIRGNSFIVSSTGDGLGAMGIRVPVGIGGALSFINFSDNYIRNESSAVQTFEFVQQDQVSAGGHTFDNNTFHSQSGTCGGLSCTDNTSTRYTNNTFRSGTYLNKINIITADTDLTIKDNTGFVTEANDNAIVTSGNTSITVNHGLDFKPVGSSLFVTQEDSGGSITKFWVPSASFNTTTFDINVDQDPGVSGASFNWQITANRFV